MRQTHTQTHTLVVCRSTQRVLFVLPPICTQSHILSDVFSVVPPEFKSHGGQRKRLAQGTYCTRKDLPGREGEKRGRGALKTTGKKHGPKEARPLSFWLVEKHWECDFLNPSLSERETDGESRRSHWEDLFSGRGNECEKERARELVRVQRQWPHHCVPSRTEGMATSHTETQNRVYTHLRSWEGRRIPQNFRHFSRVMSMVACFRSEKKFQIRKISVTRKYKVTIRIN